MKIRLLYQTLKTKTYSGTLGEFQMQNVDLLQNSFGFVKSLASALGQGSKSVPLVTDALASAVDRGAVVVLQGAVIFMEENFD